MKNIFLGLLLALSISPASWADSPLQPEVARKFQDIETETGSRRGWLRQVRAVFDTAVGTNAAAGAHGLGVYLPANSTITRGWMTISRHFDGAATIALHCEDANNIFTATDLSIANYSNGTLVRLIPQDTLATVVRGTTIASRCEVTATVGAPGQTAGGKAVVFLEYWISE